MALGQSSQMDYILSLPIRPLPRALSTLDGLLRDIIKAALMHWYHYFKGRKNAQTTELVPENSAAVTDGIAFVQNVKAGQLCFGDARQCSHSLYFITIALREKFGITALMLCSTHNEIVINLTTNIRFS